MPLVANAEVSSASMGADTHCITCCCEIYPSIYIRTERHTDTCADIQAHN